MERFSILKTVKYHCCLDRLQYYRICTAPAFPRSTFLRSLELDCHILSQRTALLHHKSLNSPPRVPTTPSLHGQGPAWENTENKLFKTHTQKLHCVLGVTKICEFISWVTKICEFIKMQ